MKKSACLWTAFVLTTGIIAGAMLHSWGCARLTEQQQRNLLQASRTIAGSMRCMCK